ncbi:MAG: zinc ribbon domain-containing protein [Candidatus Eremiobacterota bacterium]
MKLLEKIASRKEQIELTKSDLEHLEKDLVRLESDYIKTFKVGEKAIQKGYWSENSSEETEVIITAVKYEYYLDEPCYQIYTVSAADTKNRHESRAVTDLTKLRKANLCELCDAVIPAGKDFCSKCNEELGKELSDLARPEEVSEENYPCVGCGTMIPNTEPYCGICSQKMERALAA